MRKFKIIPLLLLLLTMATSAAAQKKTQKTYIPWDNGKLVVSEETSRIQRDSGSNVEQCSVYEYLRTIFDD